ncbi:MAG: site-specific integrase [Bacteroidaceae bacterium]|nr:site-specific integrase [Bacteroidaceae bacterium]
MAKIKVVTIKKDDATTGVYLRLNVGESRAHYFLGFLVDESKFDKENGRFMQGSGFKYSVTYTENGQAQELNPKAANLKLSAKVEQATKILAAFEEARKANGNEWSIQMFADKFAPKKEIKTFCGYMTATIERYINERRYKQAAITKDAIASLTEYDVNFPNLEFADINKTYIEAYRTWAEQTKKHKPNTINMRLKEVRTILNYAISSGIYSGVAYPFGKRGVTIGNGLHRTKANIYLTNAELKKLSAHTFEHKRTEIAKHLFLASVRLRGINWKDMANLKHSDIQTKVSSTTHKPYKVLVYQRSKTARKKQDDAYFTITITDAIQKELDWFKENTKLFADYLFPIITKEVEPEKVAEYLDESRKRCNDMIKLIRTELGFNSELTFYSARHSFAMGMREKGEDITKIQQALGHSDSKTTENYLKQFDDDEMSKATELDF